jgi:hypothetical protein
VAVRLTPAGAAPRSGFAAARHAALAEALAPLSPPDREQLR